MHSAISTSPPVADPSPPGSPAARRLRGPSWRDPRLVVGVLLVAASVLAGATLFSRADDTVGVWTARSDLTAGSGVGPADLVRRQVRFPDSAAADRYVSADSAIPAGATLTREVGAGELLPRAALRRDAPASLVEVPLSTAAELVPATVRPGSVVDVWVTPDPTTAESAGVEPPAGRAHPRAVLVLDDVPVVAMPGVDTSLAPAATRQVIVGVGEDDARRLAQTLALTTGGTVVLTRQG